MPTFAIAVRFELRSGCEAAFDALVARTVAAIRSDEPGTLVYVCGRVQGEPRARVFLEVYADPAAFAAHERTPAVMRFLAEREALIDGLRVERLEPYELALAPLVPAE